MVWQLFLITQQFRISPYPIWNTFMEIIMNCNYVNSNQVPGMAYVPWQRWGDYYDPCKAFTRGTLFAVLDKPFKGGYRK